MTAERHSDKDGSEQKYLDYDPFEGERDVDIRCRTVSMLTTRKPHKCADPSNGGKPHDIPAGTRARYEHALVDGEWGSYYVCIPCMDRWLKEYRT